MVRLKSRRNRRITWIGIRYLLIAVFLVYSLFPVFWIITTSLKTPNEIWHSPPIYLPGQPSLNHFIRALGPSGDGLRALRDSLIVTTCTTLLTLAIGASVAYSIARFETGGADFSFWVLSQRMLPPVVMILPIFLLYSTVKLVDTYMGLILLYTVFNLPLAIWMLRSYIIEIPVEVEECAMIDGAAQWQVLRYITLPLIAAGLSATTIFIWLFAWSEFIFALVLTRNSVLTLPVLVSRYFATQSQEWGAASATSLVAILPVIILGLLVQRHFVRGITMGAMKE
jgi:multiple sugar transport system permease protein